MTAKVVASFIGIWLGLALIGGLVDGQILGGYNAGNPAASTGDAGAAQSALQPNIQSQEGTGGGLLPTVNRWFSAGVNFLSSWANILALNSSLFTGDYAVFGWIVRFLLGIPMVTMLLIAVFGR